ncbi:MAG: hypothetical protein RR222_18525, partial [Pseudomonas sp.]|uniref:hypothetical protein n=1 Tax=Pseudomonas sp. TaxID=306 RepID=UPI002FC97B36
MIGPLPSLRIVKQNLYCRVGYSEDGQIADAKKATFFKVAFSVVWLREPDLNRRPSGYEPD